MIDTPTIVRSEARQTAVIPLVVARADIQKVMEPAIREVVATLAAQGIRPAGPLVAYHRRTDSATFDFEVGFPVTKPVQPSGRVVASQLPAKRVARTVYHGSYEGLHGAWSEFLAWIKASGYTAERELWEIYVSGPESGQDASKWRTELSRAIGGD